MKRYILTGLLGAFTCIISYAQINGTVEWKQNVDFSIQKGDEYAEILVQSMCYTEEVGSPKIPYCVKSFVLPDNAKVSTIRVTTTNRRLIGENLLIIPAQYPTPVGEGGYSGWIEPNDEVYNSSKSFPGQYAEIISDREDFGYHIVSIKFCPIEYIPLERKLYLCDLSFSLEYSMGRTISHTSSIPKKQSERLDLLDREYVRSIVDNADMLEASMQYASLNASPVEDVVPEYLIITSESLKNTFQILADWKTKKGVPTIIETVENIIKKYRGADVQEKIRNYLTDIKSTYGSLFVLLGGDTNIIPARVKKSRSSNDKGLYAVDYYYACAGKGDWRIKGNGMFVESFGTNAFELAFKLGRAPVENQVEAETFVNKVINYEKCIGIEDTRYYNNMLVVDAFIGSGKCNPYLLCDEAKDLLVSNYKKNVNQLVKSWFLFDDYLGTAIFRCAHGRSWSSVKCDTINNLYDPVPGGTCVPGNEELSSASFLNALNNGGNSNYGHFHFVYHMDHSSPDAMGASSKMKNQSIRKVDVDQLSNGNYNQIVISSGCTPADITKDCIAEHFLNNPNGGAVAFIGNTDIGWSGEYVQFQNFCNELYKKNLSLTDRYDLSYLHIKANTTNNKPANEANCSLHLFGDPEMQVWSGIPQNLNVSVTPSSIQNGSATITVTITNLPSSQIATVCLQKADEVYAVRTMQNGTQSFTVSPKTTGVVEVTVTSHNFRPFETTIPVDVSSKAVLHVSDLIFDDDKTGESNGNNDKQLDAGETIELSVALKNEGGVASGVVTGRLTCNSPEISFVNDVVSFGQIKAGTSRTSGTKFVFVIDKDCEEHLKNGQDPIEFVLTMQNGAESSSERFSVDVFAPEIKIGNQKVTWTSNGNTTVEAGETVKMNIDLMNVGQAEATGLKAVLISNNAQVSCSSAQIAYPVIPLAETKVNTAAFQLQTSSSYAGALNLTLQVSNEYGKTWSFPVNPLSRPAAIRVSTVGFQPYGSSINVYWQPVKDVSYNIYRSDNGENGAYKKLNKYPLTAAYNLDENLAERAVYYYKVAAVSANGNESEWSAACRTWTSYPAVSPFPRRIAAADYSSESCPNIADVDNDGKQEIFWLYDDRRKTRTSYLMGFRPTGEELYDIDGNVTTVSGFVKSSVIMKGQVAFGDLSGNGEQNIVVSTWDDDDGSARGDKNAVYCYSPFDRNGDHKPDLLWEKKIPYSMHQSPVVANLDGSPDGTMEVVIKSHQTPDIFILDHNGNELRRLNPNVHITSRKDYNYSALTVADLDDDGQMEIIASYDSLGIYIWRQDGAPFTTNPFWRMGDINLSSAPVVCDLNEDGKKELVFSQHDVAVSHVYAISLEGDKTIVGWDGSQTIPYTDNGFSLDHTLSVGDINNDGHLEVVILGHGIVKAWRHTGGELFSKPIDGLLPQMAYAANVNTPILADVDGDAVPDIVFCCDKSIYALHNDGSGIVGFPIVSDEEFRDTPCVADIDNDGKNELIAGNNYDLYVWKTDGVPTAIEWGVKCGNPQNTNEYSPTVCQPMLINADETWNGESPCGNVVLQSGRLVIPSGKTMTLNNTSAVIVRAGATLEVDGGSIRNARLVVQKGGTLIIKNNGLIKLRKNVSFEMEAGAVMDFPFGAIDIP